MCSIKAPYNHALNSFIRFYGCQSTCIGFERFIECIGGQLKWFQYGYWPPLQTLQEFLRTETLEQNSVFFTF